MRSWTSLELRVLRACAPLGARPVSLLLERSEQAVRSRAALEEVPLGGGDQDVDVDMTVLRILDRVRETPGLSICPMCGRRWARMRATGMCRTCHLEQLLQVHQEKLDEQAMMRRLDKARQDKRRQRICTSCGAAFFPRPSSTATVCPGCEP